ncbi:MAG: MarR family winged helix-turn-helix transcriptional regulator [Dysgonamonadaceae bacterium]|nr:MarR family winged helix-turn-helix transcriptional regulator [Dysgonamonadaceae bacterium]
MDNTLFNLAFTAKEIQLVFKRFVTDLSVDVPTEAMGILLAVYYKSDLIQQDIAEIVKKDKSAVLRHIDNLEKKGLLQRTIAANDRRRNIISITDEGKQFIYEINDRANELFSVLSEGLSSIDVEMFNKMLNHIRSKAKTV